MNDQLHDLRSIFTSRIFVIPDYQRGYAWTDDHRRDLLSDLEELGALAPSKRHFTGTLVLKLREREPRIVRGQSLAVVDVVDGQQRLTTLVILLSVMVRRLEALATDEARDFARDLRETFVTFQRVPRLEPYGDSAAFFRDHVVGNTPHTKKGTPPQERMLAARVLFEKYLDKKLEALPDDAARFAWIETWATLVTHRLGFVLFEVADEADVGVMFEAMNTRGKPLTQFELVKNYLLYAAAKIADGGVRAELVRDINETWRSTVTSLDEAGLSDADDTLLKYHWTIWPHARGLGDDPVWKTADLHRALKSTIRVSDGPEQLATRMREYLLDLRRAVPAFTDLLRPHRDRAFSFTEGAPRDSLVERASALGRLGRRAVVLPMLMACVLEHEGDAAGLAEVLRLTEVFVFRLLLRGMKSNTSESSLMQLARQVRTAKTSVGGVQQRLRERIAYYAPDGTVKRALLERDGTTPEGNFYERGVLPHLLFEYERDLVKQMNQKFTLDWGKFYSKWHESTEHILPQGERALKDPYWSSRFTADAHRRYRHRLGNLVLTEWNPHYSDHSFDRKCGPVGAPQDAKVYRNARFLSEKELVQESSWDESAIDRRQQRIADLAMGGVAHRRIHQNGVKLLNIEGVCQQSSARRRSNGRMRSMLISASPASTGNTLSRSFAS